MKVKRGGVGVGAPAGASYGHMLDVALMAGEPVWNARAFR